MRKSIRGLEFSAFEVTGKTKKKLFEYRTNGNNFDDCVGIMKLKLGLGIKKHSERNAKRMR